MVQVGDVVVLFSGTIQNPKSKWHLCVSVGEGWFFRINTKPHWGPSFALSAEQDTCLDHDCFLELNVPVEFDEYEIDEALRYPANHKGQLTDSTLTELAEHIQTVTSIPKEQREAIVAELRKVLDQP